MKNKIEKKQEKDELEEKSTEGLGHVIIKGLKWKNQAYS